jgi:hypothetical protein
LQISVDLLNVTPKEIKVLKSHGHTVVCYMSAGTYESFRPDASAFPKALFGLRMSGWDEMYVIYRMQEP